MADVLNTECLACSGTEFRVAQVTPLSGESYLRLLCTQCGRQYSVDLNPKVQTIEQLPF